MSDKLQEIKEDFAWGVKAAGQGQGYTNLDDEQVSWLIEQLEQAQAANQKLVECLEGSLHTLDNIKDHPNEMWIGEEVERWEQKVDSTISEMQQTLSEVKGNG